MTKDEALKLALEALEKISRTEYHIETPPIESLEEKMRRIAYKAITAIKEALMSGTDGAQPEPWEKFCDSNCVWTDHHPDCKLAQRTWVGLTDEDIKPFCDANHIIFGAYTIDFVRAIEAKLKEKNTHD